MPRDRKRNDHDGHWWRGCRVEQVNSAFRPMLAGRFWRAHPAPFAKTERGRFRRAARLFVLSFDHPEGSAQ
ncbi:hypothetical protein ACJ4V0_15740 [Phreatobacter sp. HK31-P]